MTDIIGMSICAVIALGFIVSVTVLLGDMIPDPGGSEEQKRDPMQEEPMEIRPEHATFKGRLLSELSKDELQQAVIELAAELQKVRDAHLKDMQWVHEQLGVIEARI